MLNRITLTGRLTHDPELHTTQSGISVVTFAIANQRNYKNSAGERDTDFFNVTAWRSTAEFITQYFSKGSLITVDGRLESRKYTDKDGNNRVAIEIIADNVYFGESIVKGRGDMIVLIDESGSTRSVAAWAKALALALLDIASKDRRKFALVHFASADRIKTDLFEPEQYKPEDVIKAAEQFFGGGTNFEAPLKEALRLMENGYENADITIITDGECALPEAFTKEFLREKATYQATVTGILLDKGGPCGKSLEPFCDKIFHSKELAEDEIAIQILNSKIL